MPSSFLVVPFKMLLYRKRSLILKLLIIGIAFIAGCIVTLSLNNVKNCTNEVESMPKQNVSISSIFLVVVILSAPKNIEQRNTIRQTWLNLKPKIDKYPDNSQVTNPLEFDESGFLQQDTIHQQSSLLKHFKQKMSKAIYKPLLNDLNVEVLHYFVIGTENLPFIESNKLSKEHAKHNDLLLLNDLSDSYSNLTLKLLKAIESVSNIGSIEYLLKIDDDTYVKLDYLLEDLYQYDKQIKRKQSTVNAVKPELYWGYFHGRANVKSRGKWKEINFKLCERYLPYAYGGGYVISRNLLHFIAQNRNSLSRYLSEDISMGVWLSPLRNVYKKHDPRFDTAYLPRKCHNYHILLHKRTPTNMRDIYRGFLCTFKDANATNIPRPNEYFYDWSLPPTHCCDTFVDQI